MTESSPFNYWLVKYVRGSDPDLASLRTALAGVSNYDVNRCLDKVRDKDNFTALYLAVEKSHKEILQQLLRAMDKFAHFRVIKKINGWTILHKALYKRDRVSVRCILESVSVDKSNMYRLITMREERSGYTAVSWAAYNRCTEAMYLILQPFTPEERFNILKITDDHNYRFTPFHSATCWGADRTKTVECMMSSLSPHRLVTLLNMKDCYDTTPLDQMKMAALKSLVNRKKDARKQQIPQGKTIDIDVTTLT